MSYHGDEVLIEVFKLQKKKFVVRLMDHSKITSSIGVEGSEPKWWRCEEGDDKCLLEKLKKGLVHDFDAFLKDLWVDDLKIIICGKYIRYFVLSLQIQFKLHEKKCLKKNNHSF